MAKVRNRFRVLLAQKEMRDGRDYTYEDIFAATGISPTTVSAYAKGRVTRFDTVTLVKLCDWLGCELSDLLEYPPVMSQQASVPSPVPMGV
jgi:DNA-binding Xre family transcriptional regulator